MKEEPGQRTATETEAVVGKITAIFEFQESTQSYVLKHEVLDEPTPESYRASAGEDKILYENLTAAQFKAISDDYEEMQNITVNEGQTKRALQQRILVLCRDAISRLEEKMKYPSKPISRTGHYGA
ncbi:MAG: hypothetical protein PHS44_07390 [Candidatus Dojkabacteria bacterium]|jgi:hypothetical protein|nr:hypothetical protein [Candidatus Dojkabacteria bacterium]